MICSGVYFGREGRRRTVSIYGECRAVGGVVMVLLLPRIRVGSANANVILWCPHRRYCNLVGVCVSCGAPQRFMSSLLSSSY